MLGPTRALCIDQHDTEPTPDRRGNSAPNIYIYIYIYCIRLVCLYFPDWDPTTFLIGDLFCGDRPTLTLALALEPIHKSCFEKVQGYY